jgi:uncharacterized protein YggU (UPF0235/DUF167 family)
MSTRLLQILGLFVVIASLSACAPTLQTMPTATRLAPTEPGREPTLRAPTKAPANAGRTIAPEPTPTASGWLYRDNNGYFAVWAPAGWKQEDFPGETVRSKVAFHHPKDDSVVIRLIVGPTAARYSYDTMLAETQGKIPALKKQFGAGATIEVSKGEVGDHKTVVLRASVPRVLEQEVVLMLNAKATIAYSTSYSTASQKAFDEHYATFRAFLEELQILESGRTFTEDDLVQAAVSKKLRLAQLHEEIGQYDLARQYVQQGLALDPDNAELKTMEERLKKK